MGKKTKKLYCYVDETGQDPGSDYFIVVTVISADDQERVREQLIMLEKESRVGIRKWHKSGKERVDYLDLVVKEDFKQVSSYFGKFKKPLPFFLPVLQTLEKAILEIAPKDYKAIIYIDGIDRKKASEMTNALRLKGINTEHIRSARDEAEPFIRLADRWAGCIRDSEENDNDSKIIKAAIKRNQLKQIT